MARPLRVARPAVAFCSRSTLTAQVLRPCIVSLNPLVVALLRIATELRRVLVWSYQATPCTAQQRRAAVRAMALYSRSTPMVQALPPYAVSQQQAVMIVRTAMEPIQLRD